jgi:poly(A) polymerase
MEPAEPSGPLWKDLPGPRAVMAALGAEKGLARFVGGCVRNTVKALPITDIDIATVHRPEETMRLLGASGITAKPTGFAHGTVTAIIKGQPFEITTLRRDLETDGRHAVVTFTDDWAEDAARRDFTMNAMFMDLAGEILDPMGGHQDAVDGRVRFVGDPTLRIHEDALRILRFFRFQAQYGRTPLDREGLKACESNAALQNALSGERIRSELLKLLDARGAGAVVRAMDGAGVFKPIFPRGLEVEMLERLIALEAALMKDQGDALRRFSILVGSNSETVPDRLKFSNKDRLRLEMMDTDHLDLDASEADLKIKLYRLGSGRFIDAVLINAARHHGKTSRAQAVLEIQRRWTAPQFPLRGADLITLGLAPGEWVGRILAEIEEYWIADGMRGSHEACLSRARNAIELDRIKP